MIYEIYRINLKIYIYYINSILIIWNQNYELDFIL